MIEGYTVAGPEIEEDISLVQKHKQLCLEIAKDLSSDQDRPNIYVSVSRYIFFDRR